VSEVTPIVDDQEMLRAYAATIKLKDADIERLKALLKDRMYELEEINELKSLLTRAADALEEFAAYISGDPDAYRYLRLKEQQLIAELRKAAE
jgi:hypothetical protein